MPKAWDLKMCLRLPQLVKSFLVWILRSEEQVIPALGFNSWRGRAGWKRGAAEMQGHKLAETELNCVCVAWGKRRDYPDSWFFSSVFPACCSAGLLVFLVPFEGCIIFWQHDSCDQGWLAWELYLNRKNTDVFCVALLTLDLLLVYLLWERKIVTSSVCFSFQGILHSSPLLSKLFFKGGYDQCAKDRGELRAVQLDWLWLRCTSNNFLYCDPAEELNTHLNYNKWWLVNSWSNISWIYFNLWYFRSRWETLHQPFTTEKQCFENLTLHKYVSVLLYNI